MTTQIPIPTIIIIITTTMETTITTTTVVAAAAAAAAAVMGMTKVRDEKKNQPWNLWKVGLKFVFFIHFKPLIQLYFDLL